jgi:4'-phosphopantetheinyl transferase
MIRWLLRTSVDHPDMAAGRLPAGLLTHEEREQFAGLLNPRRRRDWLLGRWTAKRLAQAHIVATRGFCPVLASFFIAYEASGAPYLASDNLALRGDCETSRIPLALAISHSHGYAFCTLCASPLGAVRLGADIELVGPRDEDFAKEFLTLDEQRMIAGALHGQRELMVTAAWSVKEAVLKATHLGLGADQRGVQCHLPITHSRHWMPVYVEIEPSIRVHVGNAGPLRVWWRVIDNRLLPGQRFVLTIAAFGEVTL